MQEVTDMLNKNLNHAGELMKYGTPNEAMNINQESLNTAGQENQMSVTSNNTVVNFDDEGYINGALRDICVIAVDHNNNLVMVDSEVPCW